MKVGTLVISVVTTVEINGHGFEHPHHSSSLRITSTLVVNQENGIRKKTGTKTNNFTDKTPTF